MVLKYKQISMDNSLYSKCVRLRREYFWIPYRLLTSVNFEKEESDSTIFVAYHNTKDVVGCVLLSYEPHCHWYRLRQLVVHPDVQKQGIGSKLLGCAEAYIRQTKKERIVLYAHEACFSFFEKRSYKPITGWYTHQNGMRTILMERYFDKSETD